MKIILSVDLECTDSTVGALVRSKLRSTGVAILTLSDAALERCEVIPLASALQYFQRLNMSQGSCALFCYLPLLLIGCV